MTTYRAEVEATGGFGITFDAEDDYAAAAKVNDEVVKRYGHGWSHLRTKIKKIGKDKTDAGSFSEGPES